MKKINIVVNGKGGSGKSTLSTIIAQLVAKEGLDFRYIEIDVSGKTTESLSSSKVFENRMMTITTDDAIEELYAATFQALKEDKIIIVDVGAGQDSYDMIENFKTTFPHLSEQINYFIPFENNISAIENLKDAYALIDSPENIHLVKNKVIDYKTKKDPFIFFEGNPQKGVDNHRKSINSVNKVLELKLIDEIGIAGINKESMLDIAQMAMDYNDDEAHELFIKEDDLQEYVLLMARYKNSKDSKKALENLSEEFKEILNA